MSSVPKSKRNLSKFQAAHNLLELRGEITNLAIRQFGFSKEKYEEKIQRYAECHKSARDVSEVVERYRAKNDWFSEWFIREEQKIVLDMVRDIQTEFTIGNSIFPGNVDEEITKAELMERRLHMDRAIASCYVLKNEIQYIIKALPVDMNKYKRFSKMIETQIALIKGVRQSDNRFIKKKGDRSVSDG